MKRIVLIRNSYSYDVGGAEIFPINLAKSIQNDGYAPYILSSNKRMLTMAQNAGIDSIHSPWWSFQNFSGKRVFLLPLYLVWLFFVTCWYILFFYRYHIDVVHPQSRDDFIAATIAAKVLKRKVVWTDHADLKHIYANHKKWYKNQIGKLVYATSKLANHITIASLSEKQLIEASLGGALSKEHTVVPLGVNDKYSPNHKNAAKIILVSTSRLVRDKGIVELIKATLAISDPRVLLRICGDGPDSKYLKSLAKNAKNIEFMGHVEDVSSVLRQADIFVHPTYHEGFGLSLVEAEMHALPIIASRVGSIPEIVKDGREGILVSPKNSFELSREIMRLVDNPSLRNKMGMAGRQTYLRKFQFDKIVRKRFLSLYEH